MLSAYVDESLRRRADDHSVYAMAAVIIDSGDREEARSLLKSLRAGKSPRLHWRDESPPRQLAIARRLAGMPIRGVVTVCIHGKDTRNERARRRCLKQLLIKLDDLAVPEATVESRSPEQNHQDLLLVMSTRRARLISKGITVTWQSSYEEPLLWAADAMVGAATWWFDGGSQCFDLLAGQVDLICID